MGREFRVAMRGYSRRQVDELFARIDAGRATAAELREVRFDKKMRGYSPPDVDAALSEARRLADSDN